MTGWMLFVGLVSFIAGFAIGAFATIWQLGRMIEEGKFDTFLLSKGEKWKLF